MDRKKSRVNVGRLVCGQDKLSLIDELSVVIYGSFDRSLLRMAYQQARFGDRVYGYQEVVLQACAVCFRSYMGDVYYFDGRIWCPLSDIILENALNKAMVRGGVPKSDLVNSRSKLLYSARGGASMSPLELSASVIGFRNGVWDFTDIDAPVYHSFDDRMPIVSILPYDYDPKSVCPRWLSFLESILPRGERMKLQKYLGLGCADRKSMTHKIEETLWLIGSGANGKSTIFDVVRAVYGADNISYAGLDTLLSGSSEVRARFIGSIVGKLFNYCSEIQSDDITRYSDTFKSLCSGEPQTVRRLGHNPETTFDIPFLVFNMNRRPANRNIDKALLRRLVFIPFRTSVDVSDMNRELGSELLKELSGIRNWMIEGYRMLVRDGYQFNSTKDADDEMTDYMLENGQTVQVFLNKKGYSCNRRTGHWEDRAQWVSASAIYGDYMSFCEKWLQEPVNQRAFGGEMTRLGWHESNGNRKRTKGGYVYGIFCGKEIDYAMKI
jgi:putative DNA primase/helicase